MTEAMMVKRIGELEHTLADLIQVNKTMEERLDKHGARLYTLEQLDIPQQVSIACMWETDLYKYHEFHMQLFEALENSINRDQSEELAHDLAEAQKKKKSRESPKTPPGSPSHQPPPPPPPAGSAAPSPVKTVAITEHQAWSTPDVTLKPLVSLTPEDLDLDEAMDSLLAQTGDITSFMDWFCKRRGIIKLKPQNLKGPAYEIVKVFHPDQTTTAEGPPGHVTIQSDFFFNNDLEYLRYGSKGRRPALSISKMKAAYYPDARLEQMVLDQFWIKEERQRVEDFQLGIE
nr:hypothetical protein [Tanacetum cinerariifolium]